MYVERTEAVLTLQEHCQYAVQLKTIGSMRLPAPPRTAGGGITKARLLRGDTKTMWTDFFLFNDKLLCRAHFSTSRAI